MNTVLVCDDEKDIVSALKIYLESEGYAVECAYDGAQALTLLESRDISLVLMDIMMPVMDGISAMVKIRERSNVPVILLTAKGEDTDKILGLNVGADDYITKPFNPLEVLARVRSQLRRYTMLGAAQIRQSCLTVGGISMDDSSKTVTVDGEPAALTPTEYDILRLLMENPGQVFHPRDIYKRVWKDEPYGAESTVAVHIRHLREELEINPAERRYIKAVGGQGCKMERGERQEQT